MGRSKLKTVRRRNLAKARRVLAANRRASQERALDVTSLVRERVRELVR